MPTNQRNQRTPDASRAPFRRRGSLMDHLAAANAFARLSGQAEKLRHLQALLETALPAYLLPGTRVANLKRGKLVIHAASGAVAVKLRQLAPRLTAGFVQQGQEVTAIEVRVQAHGRGGAGLRRKTASTLGPRSRQAIASLAAGLEEDSPIRRALARLLRSTARE